MGVFKNTEKNNAIQELNNQQVRYQDLNREVVSSCRSLYNNRKKMVKMMKEVEDRLRATPDAPVEQISKMATLRASVSVFETMVTKESAGDCSLKSQGKGVVGGTAAAAAGGAAVATLGPSAAIALATTFGTASTGVAISTLSGAAATNAALAALGGGAIAAGGAGMAGGNLLLAFLGPIGWGIAGVSLLSGGLIMRSKNNKVIKEAEAKTYKLKAVNDEVEQKAQKVKRLQKESLRLCNDMCALLKEDDISLIYDAVFIKAKQCCKNINTKVK